ncbi:MAG: hypothetical protein AAFU67_06060 [Bacteroidota bacterium]
MQVAVDISFYPLKEHYDTPIIGFIKGLRQHKGLVVATNQLSTQVSGEYDSVMSAIQTEMKISFDEELVGAFVLKVLNVAIEPGKEVAISD